MKKIIIIFFVFFVSVYFAEDMRKTLIVYTDGYSDVTGILENRINQYITNEGKYRLVSRDDILFKDILLQLQGLTDSTRDLKLLSADALVYVKVVNTFQDVNEDSETPYAYYEVSISYKLIDKYTGEITSSKFYDSSSKVYMTKYKSRTEALKEAKEQAVYSAAGYVVSLVNELFKITAPIIGYEGNTVIADAGRNYGVRKGMVFYFSKTVDIAGDKKIYYDGKLTATDVMDTKSILTVLEKPEIFDYRDNSVFVTEKPNSLPLRPSFKIYYSGMYNKNGVYINGAGINFSADNYFGLYFDMSGNLFLNDTFLEMDMGFAVGY
ncbi:MAG TPA: hypothetical protein PLS66_01100, partial [Tepiditoga sp.]|nr:hypothetical protein [Tepiditoga sp.]